MPKSPSLLMDRNAQPFTARATVAAAATFAVMMTVAMPGSASALDDPPAKPKVDCTKKANKGKPQCQKRYDDNEEGQGQTSAGRLSDDELYNAAYWLARQGDFAGSLKLLRRVRNSDVPRVLNATGYATRKLGDVDAALPYYMRALALDPNYTRAREYLGEAHLARGDVVAAKMQLSEIAVRCGTTCSGYPELAGQIAAFEAGSNPSVNRGG